MATASEVPLRADGSLALDVGVWLADGLTHVLFERGAFPPLASDVLLTNTATSADTVSIVVACGARRVNAATKPLVSAAVATPPHASRGSLQIAARVELRDADVELLVAVTAPDGTTTSSKRVTRTSEENFPSLFRFDRVEEPLAAYALTVDLVVRLEQQRRSGDDHRSAPTDDYGDVEPAYTASRLWPAAYELARFLLSYSKEVRHLLELGSGSGFLGAAAHSIFPNARVTLTDLEANLDLVRRNLQDDSVAALPLDWTNLETTRAVLASRPAPDLVLVADCVFWPALYDPLLDTLDLLLCHNEATSCPQRAPTVLLAVTHRLDRTARFLDRLRDRRWAATPCDHYPGSAARSANTVIFRLHRDDATTKARSS